MYGYMIMRGLTKIKIPIQESGSSTITAQDQDEREIKKRRERV